jgi:hypothetical protein
MAIFNLNGDEWNEETEHEGFPSRPLEKGSSRAGSALRGSGPPQSEVDHLSE